MEWKEKINEFALKGLVSYGTEEDLKNFISKEILEKLIAEVCQDLNASADYKQNLSEKWL